MLFIFRIIMIHNSSICSIRVKTTMHIFIIILKCFSFVPNRNYEIASVIPIHWWERLRTNHLSLKLFFMRLAGSLGSDNLLWEPRLLTKKANNLEAREIVQRLKHLPCMRLNSLHCTTWSLNTTSSECLQSGESTEHHWIWPKTDNINRKRFLNCIFG